MMKRPLLSALFLFAIFSGGCKSESDTSTEAGAGVERNTRPSQRLDFDALLATVDTAIGKRLQAMQMEAMNAATYQYDGPIETVVDIVDPIARAAGFTQDKDQPAFGMGEAEKEMQAKMGVNMSYVDQMIYTHSSGDSLMIARMDMSSEDIDMKMLTVQLMNAKKMSEFGAKAQKP